MTDRATYEALSNKVDDLEKKIESYRNLVDNMQDLFYRTDLDGRITFVSPSVFRLSGYSVQEAIGMRMAQEVYLFPEERDTFLAQLEKEGRVSNFEARLKRKDGTVWWASTNAHIYKDAGGNILGVEGITRDISELKAAEMSLRAAEERFRLAFHTSPDAINLNRVSDGMYIDINQGFTDLTGYTRDDVIGKTSLDISIWEDPADRKRLVEGLMKTGFVKNLEAKFARKNGDVGVGLMSARTFVMNDENIILSVTRDITERKNAEAAAEKLEQQLRQAQKMESVGTLAGGMAHNFNNILMGIQGRTSLMMVEKDPLHPDYEHLKGIEDLVKSAVELTRDLLGFARGGKYEVKPTDLNELIKHENRIFSRTRKEIRVHGKYEKNLWPVEVDRGQIQQALLNLYVNAWQAMPDGGNLYIQTKNVVLDEAFVNPFAIPPGRYVRISVTDTGTGMEDHIREKIFDPFFTTKETGQSSGLGLASVYGIIKNHSGFIEVDSEKGDGTTFNLYFPASEKIADRGIQDSGQDELQYGQGTVLLVDDEAMITDVGQKMLESLGYDTLVARSGKEALSVYERKGRRIDMVILDMIMPDMGGGEAYDRLRQIDRNVKVLLSSGYSFNGKAEEIMARGCRDFIQKPFSLKDLSVRVKKVLEL